MRFDWFWLCLLAGLFTTACLTSNANAQSIGEPGEVIPTEQWDASSLTIIESNGVIVNASECNNGALNFTAGLAGNALDGDFRCYMISEDQSQSIFIDGNVNNVGEISFTCFVADSFGTPVYAQLVGNNSAEALSYWGGYWDAFGDELYNTYWHNLTHPWDMDDDLETGFYVAAGTSATAATVAGGMVIAGVDVVLWGGSAAAGAVAGTTVIPEGTGMVGWVVGEEVVVISLPNTSHAVLGAQVGAVVDGVAVEGAYAFTVIKEGGEIVVLGAQNFGGVLSVPTAVINIVKAVVR
ncbi:MAG: hypothetical protein KDB03_26140 [Planctomycetales bacterium]|nr:hypothetical protein [Planctomycetales bacterium]